MNGDVCVHCGWPTITHNLCLHHLDNAIATYDALMAVLDTDANLADSLVRQAWVREVQARMADIAHRRGHTGSAAA